MQNNRESDLEKLIQEIPEFELEIIYEKLMMLNRNQREQLVHLLIDRKDNLTKNYNIIEMKSKLYLELHRKWFRTNNLNDQLDIVRDSISSSVNDKIKRDLQQRLLKIEKKIRKLKYQDRENARNSLGSESTRYKKFLETNYTPIIKEFVDIQSEIFYNNIISKSRTHDEITKLKYCIDMLKTVNKTEDSGGLDDIGVYKSWKIISLVNNLNMMNEEQLLKNAMREIITYNEIELEKLDSILIQELEKINRKIEETNFIKVWYKIIDYWSKNKNLKDKRLNLTNLSMELKVEISEENNELNHKITKILRSSRIFEIDDASKIYGLDTRKYRRYLKIFYNPVNKALFDLYKELYITYILEKSKIFSEKANIERVMKLVENLKIIRIERA